MTEVRRVAWPAYETPEWSEPMQFQQGIAGSLELFFRAFAPFQQFVGEITGYPVPVFQCMTRQASGSLWTSACWRILTRCSCSAWTITSRIRRPTLRR
jgi:hypothetical protein